MSETTNILSADDITALKTADSFSFCLNTANSTTPAAIRCTRKLRSKQIGPFERSEQEADYTITVTPGTTARAHFFMMFRAGTMDAIAALVRVGDELRMSARQNNNQYMDNAELFNDELLLSIVRTDARGKQRAIVRDMVIASSHCPNNSARAITSR